MKKTPIGLALLVLTALWAFPAVAQKESHKGYASLKFEECNDCHKGEGVSPNHGADWAREHRLPAGRPAANCIECHGQAFCLDCHKGGGIDTGLSTQNYKRDYIPKSHRSEFREIHPLKAKDNPQTCTRCHDQKYCQECHAKFRGENLEVLSHRRQFKDIKLTSIGPNHAGFIPADCQLCHPGGALPSHQQWAGEHAREARRNLQSCQACHNDGDVCMTCHSARTGLRVNPHPRNWGSIAGKYKDRSGGRTCVRCHDNF